MKYIIPFLLILILIKCSNERKNTEVIEKVEQEPSAHAVHFEFLDIKAEQFGENVNTMEHYAIIDKLDIDALKKLCEDQKNNFTSGTFFFIVIFDEAKNAAFPSDPFTAAYGMEADKMKHIKAFYTFNRKNGYSKLNTYKENMYESLAEEIEI